MASSGSVAEVCRAFLRLGLTSFGGPIAHLGYIRAECVERRQWLPEEDYADIVALCQFLPGPASSQVAFAVGWERAGPLGALGASVAFLTPSALAMMAFAYGVSVVATVAQGRWIAGLELAAIAVVAQAVWSMGQKLCPDAPRLALCLASAALCLVLPGAASQGVAIAAGSAVGLVLPRPREVAAPRSASTTSERHRRAAWALVPFFAILGTLPFLPGSGRALDAFGVFYRAGSLVFGGGHVVLPLLREAIVARGWLTDDALLAGYGAAQAVPGPLFSFAGYLGVLIWDGPRPWLGGLCCLLAIFLPSWLLVAGCLPFWRHLRAQRWTRAVLRGASAAVVGVLLAALYTPVMTRGIASVRDLFIAVVGFVLLERWKTPPWLVVLLAIGARSFG